MPCTPAKARHLFKKGLARPKRNKLGLFCVQLCYEQQPDNQPLVVGIDPGSKFEGFSVVGTQDTVKQTMSLHEYWTNKRLTQGAKIKDCRPLTWVAFRSWLVSTRLRTSKGATQSLSSQGMPFLLPPKRGVFPVDFSSI